jgi:hypothetical protein
MALTSTDNFKEYAGITHTDDDTLIGNLITRAQSIIEEYCGRAFNSASYRQRYDGTGDTKLRLDEYPVTGVTLLGIGLVDPLQLRNTSGDAAYAGVSVYDDGTTMKLSIDSGTNNGDTTITLSSYTLDSLATYINGTVAKNWAASVQLSDYGVWNADELLDCYGLQALDQYVYCQVPETLAEDFRLYEDEGILYRASGFTSGRKNITVRYTAGYATIPGALEQACIDLVNDFYKKRQYSMSVKAERLGDHSITFGGLSEWDIPKGIRARLQPYRKIET